jgi:gliding motility-associated-like protein
MGRMKLFLTAMFISTIHFCSAQAVAGRQVVGSCGMQNNSGNIAITNTTGESIIGTYQNTGYKITQGFQQGKTIGVITLSVETVNASCPSSTDGSARVVNIVGCEPPYLITWSNGSVGEEVDRFSPGSYTVTVTSANCQGQQSFVIGTGPADDCRIRFFNAFSPNGDQYNDTWIVENIHLDEFVNNKIEIFNRWGQSIWKGENYDNSSVLWDGKTSGGNTMPAGTYFFVADFSGTIHKGFIELTP